MERRIEKIMALVVCVMLFVTVGVSCGLVMKNNGSFSEKEENKQEALGEVSDGGLIAPEHIEGNGISLTVQKIASENASTGSVSVSAILTPSDVTDTLNWTFKWKDASSSWANGKLVSDYISYSISSDTLCLTVSQKEQFCEQIIITVIATSNKTLSASCTVDCSTKISGGLLSNEGSSTYFIPFSEYSHFTIPEPKVFSISPTSIFSPFYIQGSIDDEFEFSYTARPTFLWHDILADAGYSTVACDHDFAITSSRKFTMGYMLGMYFLSPASITKLQKAIATYETDPTDLDKFFSAGKKVANSGGYFFDLRVTAVGKYWSGAFSCSISADPGVFTFPNV